MKEVRRVLVFYEWSVSGPGIALVDKEIRLALQRSPYQIELYAENLETSLFPDESSQRESREWLIHKYRDQKPDLIIAEGPPSIRFLEESRQRFFPGTPVIFCCSPESDTTDLRLDSNFTGTLMRVEPAKTLEAALRLQAGTKRVVVVGGVSPFDRHVEEIVRQSLQPFERTLEVTYLTDLEMPALLEKLKHLPDDTVVLYSSLTRDAAGTTFIDASEVVPMVAQAANAPIFAMADVFVGRGPIGGYVCSYAEQGRIIGQMATEILQGKAPSEIPIARDTNTYMFDWRAIQRWKLKASNIPPGSVVLNRQPTLWEAHKRYVIGAVAICLAEMLLISGLLWQRARRKKIGQLLVERLKFEALISDLSTKFISLPEEQVDLNLEESLRRIGECLNIQRITLREFSRDEKELATNFSWNAEGLSPSPTVVNTQEFLWSTERIRRGEVCLISELDELPAEALAEREYLQKENVVSAAAIPLVVGDAIIGVISFVSTQRRISWTESLVSQLRVLSEILSNALRRKYAMQELRASVAELRAAEAVLRESEERFRLVANNAPVLIWMSGPDKLCTYVNDPWLNFSGRSLDDELGNGWITGLHPEDRPQCLNKYVQAFDRRDEFKMDCRLRRCDGEYRWVEGHGVPRLNPDGSFAGYIGSCIDVTDRKLAAEALSSVSGRLIEAQEQERTRIARELHDDINQRLAVLAIELDELKKIPVTSLAELQKKVDPLLKFTADISVDIQGLSHRLHSSKLEYLGIVPAMRGFCSEFAGQQKVKVDFTSSNVPDRLGQEISLCLFRILQEALSNAVRYSGAYHFEAQLKGLPGEVQLTVRDFGKGFDVEAAQRGRGLGLISMRERVGLVKGTISIQSRPMRGTQIEVRIPLVSEYRQAKAI